MREIKFRAWDGKHNRMIYDDILVYHEDGRLFSGISDPNEDWSEPQLLQFTGLLDKNGKEIYEGDILNALMHPGRYYRYRNVFVEYLDGCFQFLNVNDSTDGYYWFDINPKDCEVIGNIYENSDLLS